jgi:hypothetical protein
MCRLTLKKGHGARVGYNVDINASTCINLVWFNCAMVARSSEASPCSNVPINCPLCPAKMPAVWMYNLHTHFCNWHKLTNAQFPQKVQLLESEKHGMCQIWEGCFNIPKSHNLKNKKKEALTLSEAHSSRTALQSVHICINIDMIMRRNIAEDEFSSDREPSDIKLDVDEDFLTYDHQSDQSNAESIDDEQNLPPPVRIQLQPPSPVQSETTTAPSELAFAPNMEPTQAPEMTQSNAILSPGPSHQTRIEHLGQCESSHNEPIQVPTTAQIDSSTETSKHKQKSRTFDLNACICGSEVSEVEIEEGDTVMRCKVPGCETEWV